MNGNRMGAISVRILLLIWGFGLAAILSLFFLMDMQSASCDPYPSTERTVQPALQFPCPVVGTPLILEHLAAYDGAFFEDGSDREVTGVMAAMLRNPSDRELAAACVTLRTGEQTLEFYAQNILPGAAVLVLEKSAAAYTNDTYDSCWGNVVEAAQTDLLPHILQIREEGMGTLVITNLSEELLGPVTLYYKMRPPGQDFYMGGVTYRTTLEQLLPRQSVRITPYHYVHNYSCVVKVHIEKGTVA